MQLALRLCACGAARLVVFERTVVLTCALEPTTTTAASTSSRTSLAARSRCASMASTSSLGCVVSLLASARLSVALGSARVDAFARPDKIFLGCCRRVPCVECCAEALSTRQFSFVGYFWNFFCACAERAQTMLCAESGRSRRRAIACKSIPLFLWIVGQLPKNFLNRFSLLLTKK